MKKRFDELFQRYLDETATQPEKEELSKMIMSGEYDDDILDRIGEAIQDVSRDVKSAEHNGAQPAQETLRVVRNEQRETIALYRLRTVQIAASVVLLMGAFFWWFSGDRFPTTLPETPIARTGELTTKKERIVLPDGSVVFLNANSSISYGEDFGVDNRTVALKGEGFFDVKHDDAKPFSVHSLDVKITVLGTAFNVNAYPTGDNVTVTVARGLVEVAHGKQVYGKIQPDQEIVVNASTFRYEISEVNAKKASQWTDNFLLLDNVTLSQASRIFEDRYGVKVVFSNPALADCKIQGAFLNDESLKDVLDKISTITHWNYEREGDTVTIKGEGCY